MGEDPSGDSPSPRTVWALWEVDDLHGIYATRALAEEARARLVSSMDAWYAERHVGVHELHIHGPVESYERGVRDTLIQVLRDLRVDVDALPAEVLPALIEDLRESLGDRMHIYYLGAEWSQRARVAAEPPPERDEN